MGVLFILSLCAGLDNERFCMDETKVDFGDAGREGGAMVKAVG